MKGTGSNNYSCSNVGVQQGKPASRPRVLVVEPEALLRWSLTTYLDRWFTVFAAESQTAAQHILETDPIEALVVSKDLSDQGAKEVEELARARNPSVRIIGTVTHPSQRNTVAKQDWMLEKPFDLAELAKLLGVGTEAVGR